MPAGIGATLNLATAAGILGYVGNGLTALADRNMLNLAWQAGALCFAVATVLLVAICIRDRAFLRAWQPPCFAALSILFFLPALLSDNALAAFWSYAIAHGAQYLIFSLVASKGADHRRLGLKLIALSLSLSIVILLYGLPGMGGVYMGIVCAHFLIDAKLWRLREPVQRGFIRERFAFVFARA